MIRKIAKVLLPRKTYENIKRYAYIRNLSNKIQFIRRKHEFCIVFIATPLHGNLGDHAIVYSQERFFADRGLEKQIVEINSPDYQRYSQEIKEIIKANDIIVIDGGGSMGSLWLKEEHKMQDILKRFPENPIIIFPQTIFYSNDNFGKLELKNSAEVYSAHRNLHICAREEVSYDFMKKVYPTVDILLVPDMVLYLSDIQRDYPRDGVLLCLREDKEKQLDNKKIEKIVYELKQRGLNVRNESTVIPECIPEQSRILKLDEKWNKFSSAKIVITDRLHGMIFAAITGTPCIAFDNSSGKVGNVYNWIKKLPYIHFVNDSTKIEEIIDDLILNDNVEYKYDNTELRPYYNELFDTIKRASHL